MDNNAGFQQGENIWIMVDDAKVVYEAKLSKTGSSNSWTSSIFNLDLKQGRYLCDVEILETSSRHIMIGIVKNDIADLKSNFVGAVANSWSYYVSDGNKRINGNASQFGQQANKGDKIRAELNVEREPFTLKFYRNNICMGVIQDLPNAHFRFCISLHNPGDHLFVKISKIV